MRFQRIIVVGAGAIGSSYGALLSTRNDVLLVGNERHVKSMSERGLVLSGAMNGVFRVKASTSVEEIPPDSLVLLATKVYDIQRAVISVRGMLREDTVILALQNGIRIKEMVEGAAGGATVVRGVTSAAAEFFEPGKVSFWPGWTIIEWSPASERIAAVLNECGLKTKISEDIRVDEWKKLVVNCVVNPLTAILRVRNNEIMEDSLREIRRRVVEECVAVARAEGVELGENMLDRIERALTEYKNYSSMCQDVMKGKRTEIDFLNGKVVELGKKHGIPVPVNEALVGLVRAVEGRVR